MRIVGFKCGVASPLSEASLFCPNCGTKNPETATTCGKCGFNIKGAAAPKFKGTMLMMNQNVPQKPPQAGQPAPVGAPPAAAKAPLPGAGGQSPGAPAHMAKPSFKGTMVGVAPPAGFPYAPPGAPAAPPAAAAPAPAQPSPVAAAMAPTQMGGYGLGPGGYSPPAQPQEYGTPGPAAGHGGAVNPLGAGVNPLGGTVAIDQVGPGYAPPGGSPPGYGAAPPPQQHPAHGAPPAQGGQAWGPPPDFGPPPGQGYGPPPGQGYGPPPGGFGAPQAGYGASPGAGYGPPGPGYAASPQAQYGYGAPDAAMIPGGGSAMAPAGGYAPPGAANREHIRNPMVVTLLCYVTCGIYAIIVMYSLLSELKGYLNREEIVPWHILVPILNLVVILTKLPAWVTEAKQRAGSRNPVSAGPLLYFLLLPYFFTKDMNEVWDPTTSGG